MTKNDIDAFAELWKRTKIAFDAYSGKKASPERMEMFFDDLKPYDIAHVERAFEHWRKTGGGFPKPKDIQASIHLTRRVQALDEMPAFNPEDPYYCTGCRDSGWQDVWCPGDADHPQWDDKPWLSRETLACGRQHYPLRDNAGQQEWRGHEYSKRCLCHLTNPVLRARRNSGVA